MVPAITGLVALLNASAGAFQTLKYAGVAYLLYLAWQTWRDQTPLEIDQQSAPRSVWQVICTRSAHQCIESEAGGLLLRVPAAVCLPWWAGRDRHLVGLSLVVNGN
jgi:hypothetical protein